MLLRFTGLLTALLFAFSVIGCTESPMPETPVLSAGDGHDDHGHGGAHDHPETFGEAFAELTELHGTIKTAFGEEDEDAAHGPLHDVGHILEEVSELAGNSELSDEAIATIESNVEKLLDAFGAVDERMHDEEGKAGKAYSEVAAEIETAIAAIKEAAGELAEEHGHHDEHGEHKDHDDHGDHKDGDADHEKGHKDGDHDEKGEHKDGDADHDKEHKDGDSDADEEKDSDESAKEDAGEKPAKGDKKE